jgi:hypothetical protein
MAKFVYDDVSVTVNSVDLSSFTQSVTLSADVTEVDVTAMSDEWDQSLAGRKKVSGSITFYQDFSVSSVDATIWPLIGTTTTITLRATSAAVGATNPDYDITNTVITSYGSINGGTYGDAAMTTVNFSGGTLLPATS